MFIEKKKNTLRKQIIFRRLKGVKIRGGQKNKGLSVFIFFIQPIFYFFYLFIL